MRRDDHGAAASCRPSNRAEGACLRLTRRLPGSPIFALALVALAAAGIARADSIGDRRHEIRDRLSEKRLQIEQARSREQELAREIAAQSDQIDAVESRVSDLGSEVAALESRLSSSRARLAAIEERLGEQTEQLRRLRRELTTAEELLSTRVVQIYMSGRPDLIDVALGAESLGSLLDQVEYYRHLLAQDSQLVEGVREKRGAVARTRAETARLREGQAETTERLAQEAAARRAAYADIAAERDRLSSLRQDRQGSLAEVEVRREEWEAEAQALEAESARLASIIASAPAPAPGDAPTAPPSSSGFVWPVRGTIVSPFGLRWGRLHAGIDIAAPGGTPIAAAAAGTVIYSGAMSGYGNLVVIQHAGEIATAYAHNSSNAVSVGQPVAQGQTIASVGCTGRCYGDHVHFEVRVNGNPVDPLGYL